MISIVAAAALCTAALSGLGAGCATARPTFSGMRGDVWTSDPALATPLRRLQAGTQEIRIADFSALPKSLSGVFDVPDTALTGRVTVPGDLVGPAQARQLVDAVESELAAIPAKGGAVTDELQFPGANIKGANLRGAKSNLEQAFPTVWAPFRSGWVFRTADYPGPPGTVLHLSNMTLVLPDATYSGVHSSGFMDFVDLGENGHVCFTNSVLVLASCKGYDVDTYKMWCCNAERCNIVYTQERLDSLEIDTGDPLDYIPCHGLDAA